jgi:SAM-dependent methyltransferase
VARYSATRVVAEPRRVIAALRVAARRRRADDPVEIRRPAYQADLAGGTARFFEPRRDSCPWCASTELRMRLRTSDLFQHKPGEFELDECAGCGHIFQNPRLNADGLRFYYRDFYDGLGEELLSSLFSWCTESYRSRSEALRPFGEPESWLDVGTGHGHFCSVASAAWPQTAFDGLDMADGIELAQRRRWVRRGYRGMFVELAPELSCEYDVVSMFHYLEHTPDPHLELDAARTALRPGGHLLIEVPDPECRWGSLLGRWWLPWFQPQHLHLIPVGNLRRRLEDMGFTIVLEQHAEPNEPVDLLSATLMALGAVAPPDDLPWLAPRTGRVARAARAAVMAGALPALYGAGLADRLIEPVRARAGLTNCYRLLARKC